MLTKIWSGLLCVLSLSILLSFTGAADHAQAAGNSVEYTIVTNEIKSAPKGMKELEVYRFDPSVVIAHVGDDVTLHFYGVKGSIHPTTIAAYGIRVVVQRGSVSTVKFRVDKPGYFPIVCQIHKTIQEHGPMTGMLIVLPNP